MTTTTEPQTTLKLNYKDRDYDYSELPRRAQLILQDMVRLDQQVNQLQFELRHLQAARQVYSSSLLKSMNDEENDELSPDNSEDTSDSETGHHD